MVKFNDDAFIKINIREKVISHLKEPQTDFIKRTIELLGCCIENLSSLNIVKVCRHIITKNSQITTTELRTLQFLFRSLFILFQRSVFAINFILDNVFKVESVHSERLEEIKKIIMAPETQAFTDGNQILLFKKRFYRRFF